MLPEMPRSHCIICLTEASDRDNLLSRYYQRLGCNIAMRNSIKAKALEVMAAISPPGLAVGILRFAVIRMPTHLFLQFIIGAATVIGGMILFLLGVEIGILPMRIPIGPEKEIVLSITYPEKTEAVLDAIVHAGELDKPGTGIAFVVPVEKLVGVAHRCDDSCEG